MTKGQQQQKFVLLELKKGGHFHQKYRGIEKVLQFFPTFDDDYEGETHQKDDGCNYHKRGEAQYS